MLKTNKHDLIATQRSSERLSKFKIRLPHNSMKKIQSYRSWNRGHHFKQKIASFQKQKSRDFLKFVRNFRQINSNNGHKSLTDIMGSKSLQRSIQDQEYCVICIYHEDRQIRLKYKVNSIANLINFLKKNSNQAITFCTLQKDLKMDYLLTLQHLNASFLNGSHLNLQPIYRIQQQIITLNSFKILKCIGTGGFSKDGKLYAMKIISKQFIVKNKKKKIVMNQRNIMKQLQHPFLVQMKFAFQSKQSLIFVMEYCPGGQLFSLVKKFKRMREDIAKFYIIEILLGLEKIHDSFIVYRDFKPENILLDIDGHVRIADFGLAKPDITSFRDKAMSFCGSPQYMPPQMILKSGHSYPVDFYCIGALLYELVTGLPPFYSKDPNKIYQSTLSQQLTFPNHTKLSYEIQQLLLGLLQKNQKFRKGSISGVKQILAHPWFGKINKKDYLQKKIKPPVSFSTIQQFNFQFDDIKQNNNIYVAQIIKQQRQQQKKYQKVMVEFYYDYRNPHIEDTIVNENIPIESSVKKIFRSKYRQNVLTSRAQTSQKKLKKVNLSVENRYIGM